MNLCAVKCKVTGELYFQLQFFDHSGKTFLSCALIMKKIGNDGCGEKIQSGTSKSFLARAVRKCSAIIYLK